MRWGRILEPVVAEEWARREALLVEPAKWIRGPEPFCGSPDFMVREPCDGMAEVGVLEVKTTAAWMRGRWGTDGGEGDETNAPPWVVCQVQHYLMLTGLARGWIAVLVGGQELRSFPVERDDALIDAMVTRCREWWSRYIVSGERPPMDGSNGADEWLRQAFPSAERPEPVELPAEAAALARDYMLANDAAKAAECEKKRLGQELKAVVGDAARAEGGGFRVNWSSVKGRVMIDSKRLEAEQPETYQRFAKHIAGYRARRVTETKR